MVSHDDADACESCGDDDRRTSRNRLPEGTSLVLCHSCIRQIRRWWSHWSQYIQPEWAAELERQARRDERRRERQAVEGVL